MTGANELAGVKANRGALDALVALTNAVDSRRDLNVHAQQGGQGQAQVWLSRRTQYDVVVSRRRHGRAEHNTRKLRGRCVRATLATWAGLKYGRKFAELLCEHLRGNVCTASLRVRPSDCSLACGIFIFPIPSCSRSTLADRTLLIRQHRCSRLQASAKLAVIRQAQTSPRHAELSTSLCCVRVTCDACTTAWAGDPHSQYRCEHALRTSKTNVFCCPTICKR